jgi:hypothetical protein
VKRGAVRKSKTLPCKKEKEKELYIHTHRHTLVRYSSPVALVSPGGCDIDRHRWCLAGEKRRARLDEEKKSWKGKMSEDSEKGAKHRAR